MLLPTKIDLLFDEFIQDNNIDDICNDNECIADFVSDCLSDTFGFCTTGFRMSVDRKNNNIHIYNIKWDTTEN